MTRLLHDTCVNTLGAIRDGSGARNVEAVRSRCASDLAQLEAFAAGVAPDVKTLVDELVETVRGDAMLLGLTVEVDARDDGLLIEPAVWRAARGAVREALMNVAKHAGLTAARVRVQADVTGLTVVVRDDGRGWDGSTSCGRGIDRSIRARVHGTGGSVQVGSAPGSGTTITMVWRMRMARRQVASEGRPQVVAA